MELVGAPPYIIDFAKVRIDRPPDFSEETMRGADEKCEELFSASLARGEDAVGDARELWDLLFGSSALEYCVR